MKNNFFTSALLCLAIILSVGRNILSKHISRHPFGTDEFFLAQGFMFTAGTICLAPSCILNLRDTSACTFIYALIYGLLLISSQWCYTAALRYSSTSICATVYSFGFIIPTLAGTLFWNEKLTLLKTIGILLVIPAVFLSTKKENSEEKDINKLFAIPLIIAMLSSGFSGIMQKLQQKSGYAEEKEEFILLAFILASATSFLVVIAKNALKHKSIKSNIISPVYIYKHYGFAVLAGICYSCCNVLNTTLAGKLDSAIFFPVLNIGIIILSMFAGFLFYKERFCNKDFKVILLGILAVLFLTI